MRSPPIWRARRTFSPLPKRHILGAQRNMACRKNKKRDAHMHLFRDGWAQLKKEEELPQNCSAERACTLLLCLALSLDSHHFILFLSEYDLAFSLCVCNYEEESGVRVKVR